MTHSSSNARLPGRFLLRLARLVFDEAVVAAVVLPTIADMQQEVAAAGAHPVRRAQARLRGWAAFWSLMFVAPFAAEAWPVRRDDSIVLPVQGGGMSGWVLLAAVLAFTSPALGPWTAATIIGGVTVAVAIHLWYGRHPGALATGDEDVLRRPEINFSSLPIGANIGGLMFMAGSMAILVAGLPEWRWFFGGAVLGGFLTAGLLYAWHTTHPASRTPENRLLLR